MVLKTWEIVYKYHHFVGLFLVVLVTALLYLKGDRINWNIVKVEQIPRKDSSNISNYCNLFSGKWVYDNKSYPLYKEKDCSIIEDGFACEKFWRKDFKYQNWRWQPHHCDLPRFNGEALLEKIRGKKLMFVGDSLGRNQWESMVCLVESTISPSSKSLIMRQNQNQSTLFLEYNATIEFHWSPFLIESNHDNPFQHGHSIDRILRIEAIEKHARHWTEADILVFDSYTWWLEPNITLLWGSFGSSDAIYRNVHMRLRPYEMALRTWSDWLEFNLNRTKTKLFFMSMSPIHSRGQDWGGIKEKNCYGETEPIQPEEEMYLERLMNYEFMEVAESAVDELDKRLGIKVQYLNITHLSAYRKEAHPSTFKKKYKKKTRPTSNSTRVYSDCMHWCLPGVPDIWNQILYAYIMNS